MDLQLLIAVNVMVLSGFSLASLLFRRDWRLAWVIAVQAGILVVGLAGLYFNWLYVGFLVAGLFVFLVLLPGALNLIGSRNAAKGDTELAARYARWAYLVHPTPLMQANARVAAAQAIVDPAASAAALREMSGTVSPSYATQMEMLALRAEDRWQDVLTLITKEADSRQDLIAYKIRALGETGRFDEMVQEYAKHRTLLPADVRGAAELFVLAFCGRRDAVATRVADKKLPYNEDTRDYWRGIAALNAGNVDTSGLERLARASYRGTTHLAAARHLQQGVREAASQLSPESVVVLDTIVARSARAARLVTQSKSLYATYALILFNCIIFAVELAQGGAENLSTLFDLGAMWPPAVVIEGQWWRLASATFLHFGWAHVVVNMFSLYVLGMSVEARFGSANLLLIYIIGGIGSSAAVLALMWNNVIDGGVYMGASGAIMALLGALAAYQLVNWLHTRDVLDRRPVLAMCAIVAVQFAIDMSIPQVSLAGHASGLAIGFLVALLLAMRLLKPAST
jgi:rhomboid protease GluP